MVLVVDSHETEVPDHIFGFVEQLLKSTDTGRENSVLAVLLGGAHSKALQNVNSDIDLTLFYTTTARNLVSFNRKTMSIVPKNRFKQVATEPVLYEWRGNKYELDTVPARRVGEGNDLFGNLQKCNMHVIHSLLKDYPVATKVSPAWSREFNRLVDVFRNDEFELSVEAVVGYFRGYATSQLLSHRRKGDYQKRELKSYRTHDPSPVVKAIMNGMYIGLSGLFLLDERSVSRDFHKLWRRYDDMFSHEENEFISMCWAHKTDRSRIADNIDRFLKKSAEMRDSIFRRIAGQFDVSKDLSIRDGRFKVEIDQRKNNELLDRFQVRWLSL